MEALGTEQDCCLTSHPSLGYQPALSLSFRVCQIWILVFILGLAVQTHRGQT